jgi:hypothetical protein
MQPPGTPFLLGKNHTSEKNTSSPAGTGLLENFRAVPFAVKLSCFNGNTSEVVSPGQVGLLMTLRDSEVWKETRPERAKKRTDHFSYTF